VIENKQFFINTGIPALIGLLFGLVLPICAYAQEVDSLQIGIMDFNAWRKNGDHPAGLQGEYRFATCFVWGLQPMVGAFVNTEGGTDVYAGIYRDFHPAQRLIISPNFSVSAYRPGESKNLGGALEFQSGLDFYTPVGHFDRVGLSVRHISNAHIYSHNPGTENIILFYSRAFGR
jgi:hypothetical protein